MRGCYRNGPERIKRKTIQQSHMSTEQIKDKDRDSLIAADSRRNLPETTARFSLGNRFRPAVFSVTRVSTTKAQTKSPLQGKMPRASSLLSKKNGPSITQHGALLLRACSQHGSGNLDGEKEAFRKCAGDYNESCVRQQKEILRFSDSCWIRTLFFLCIFNRPIKLNENVLRY
jgi:hypothetical protein